MEDQGKFCGGIKVIEASDYNEVCANAANMVKSQVAKKPNSVLGLATGSSALGIYEQLTNTYKKGEVDFSKVSSINLDEYVGLASNHPQSYRYYMNQNFFNHVNIPLQNTHLPNGVEEDYLKECKRYEDTIKEHGGIDLQILGLGHNGHIAFNEPDSSFYPLTHRVELTESTIQANKRFFDDEKDVPRFAYTLGMRGIMQAKSIVMVVSGKAKAQIIKEAFAGPITPQVPASILQLHNNFTLIGDTDALSVLLSVTQ